MNKKLSFIISIVMLGLMSILPAIAVSASTGQAAVPSWTDCRGAHPHGNVEIGAAIGQSSASVSWSSPGSTWLANPSCQAYLFTQSEATVYISSPGLSSQPSSKVCTSTSCSGTLALFVIKQFCVGHTCTGQAVPYNLKYGDTVTVEVTTTYAGFENYFGSYTLSVTS